MRNTKYGSTNSILIFGKDAINLCYAKRIERVKEVIKVVMEDETCDIHFIDTIIAGIIMSFIQTDWGNAKRLDIREYTNTQLFKTEIFEAAVESSYDSSTHDFNTAVGEKRKLYEKSVRRGLVEKVEWHNNKAKEDKVNDGNKAKGR